MWPRPLPEDCLTAIGGKFAARTLVASFRPEKRFRRFEDARSRAAAIDGVVVVDLAAGEREVWVSPGAAAVRAGQENPRSW